jgi:molybdopterin-guanine dinucleotide biosynthesis protein A
MSSSQDTTGLILAGGAGVRVGGADKGLLTWRDEPMAAHVARRLRPQVTRLLISCNRNREFYATLADTTVADSRRDFQGPLAGLEAAIPHVKGTYLIVVPCDNPLLPLDLVERLLDPLLSADGPAADISVAHDGERAQFLCAALRASVLPSLTPFLDEGHRAVRLWYARHRCSVIDFSSQAHCFANYNHLDKPP